MNKYDEYSEIVRIKILILKYGVKFEPLNMFNNYENINKYKIKRRVVKPVATDFQVYDLSEDKTIIPSEVLIDDGMNKSIVKLRYSNKSPLMLKINENGNINLEVEGVKSSLDISLVKTADILNEKIPSYIVNNNSTIGDYIDIVGIDRVSILFFEGCYNWLVGKPCKFCDLHPKEEDSKYKPSLNSLKNFKFDVEEWWESKKNEYLKGLEYSLRYLIEKTELEHLHIFFMAGNLPTNKEVWNIAEETIEYLAKTINLSKYDNYINIAPHDDIKRVAKMKQLGIKQVQYNLEVVNKQNFEQTCPGKMEYDEFIRKMEEAVNIMGKGGVRSNFVLGLDDMSETLEFAKKIADKGIVFDYSVFQPKKCTPYENKKAPDFDSVIEFTRKLSKIYKEKGLNPIFCSLSSRSSIVNELFREE